MANPHRGEVSIDLAGKPYTLVFTTNALCELEDALDRSSVSVFQEIAASMSDVSRLRLSTIRALLWAGLRDRHAALSLREVGDLMNDESRANVLTSVLKAMSAAFGEGSSAEGGEAPKA